MRNTFLAFGVMVMLGPHARAQTPPATDESLTALVRRTILDNLPREFADANHWGEQREVFSGLKIKTNDGRLRISKRTKEVNDGAWTQYHINLIDPEQNFRVQVAPLRRISPGKLAAQVNLSVDLQGETRYERWRRGIKMLNFKADARSTVEVAISAEILIRPLTGAQLGTWSIEPTIQNVRLELVDIDLDRVSRIDGKVAEEMGDRLRPVFNQQLRERQDEIARRLNETLQQHADKLQFSAAALFASGWEKIQRAITAVNQTPPVKATPQ